ncbi:MAG: glycosyltransferase [Bacteroidota bacterium]
MKILLFINNLNIGGAQTQIVNLAIGLKKKVEEVCMVTYFDENQYLDKLDKANIEVVNLKKSGKIDIMLSARLAKLCRSKAIDCVIAYQQKPSFYALVSKVLFGNRASIIVSERTYESGVPKFDKLITRNLYSFASAIVANSYHQAEILREKNKSWRNNVNVIYNGLDEEFFDKDQMNSGNTILSVGRVDPIKNLEKIIEALSILKKEKIPFRYKWVGESFSKKFKDHYDYRLKIDELIKSNDLENEWEWHPKTPEIKKHYRDAEILIHFSKGEGFPNVIMEGMASGLCVFASDVGDHHRILNDQFNGYLCPPEDSTLLANKLKVFLALEKKEQDQIKSNAVNSARTLFSKEKLIEEYYNLTNQTVKK